jgi:hypothetical protein
MEDCKVLPFKSKETLIIEEAIRSFKSNLFNSRDSLKHDKTVDVLLIDKCGLKKSIKISAINIPPTLEVPMFNPTVKLGETLDTDIHTDRRIFEYYTNSDGVLVYRER